MTTIALRGTKSDEKSPPKVFQDGTRGTDEAAIDRFLPPGFIEVEEVIDTSATARALSGAEERDLVVSPGQVVVLEMADGITVVISPEELERSIARVDPSAIDGQRRVVLQRALADRDPLARGWIAEGIDGLITRVYKLTLGRLADPIVAAAIKWLGGKAEDYASRIPELGASWLGTKALMWAIEDRLERVFGFYRWDDLNYRTPIRERDERLAADAKRGPLLIFVHGTGSDGRGSFGDLESSSPADWRRLEERYGDRIFAFEHRTFSESPIENAAALASVLPEGAIVHLVTHSRGGLVGDLLCLEPGEHLTRSIDEYGLTDGHFAAESEEERRRITNELREAHAGQRKSLGDLHQLLLTRSIRVERYVRVACPARGTRLASENFDVFLSGLLSLIGWIPGLQGNPIYSALKRVVLEVARNRTKPNVVPGIEAMLPESPLPRFLASVNPRPEVEIGVIAGDTEGRHPLAKLAIFFTDFMFDGFDNDLIVDTSSMYAGVARSTNARVLFERGQQVNHFRYFGNAESREPLCAWLTAPKLEALQAFVPLRAVDDAQRLRDTSEVRRAAVRGESGERRTLLPIVVLIPDIMGSHLRVERERIWFDAPALAAGGFGRLGISQRVAADELLSLAYGRLSEHLQATHQVEHHAYDWRQSPGALADGLAKRLEELLKQPRPVRILAHGMGGLVLRAVAHTHKTIWEEFVARRGARLVMLGTPHHGSFGMVETLIGKGQAVRSLALFDKKQDLAKLLQIVAAFPGALALLPLRNDPEESEFDFFEPTTWERLRSIRDRWFEGEIVALPDPKALGDARRFWAQLPAMKAPATTVAIVHGVAPRTPSGLQQESKDHWRMLGTVQGDGVVTWDSANLPGVSSQFWMNCEHSALADAPEYFDSLTELLERGTPGKLMVRPPVESATPHTYDAGPPVYPTEVELAGALLGARRRVTTSAPQRSVLSLSVTAMDLRGVNQPLLLGHYDEDSIAGPEALADRWLVDGELRRRHNLGVYAGRVGSAIAVLLARNELQRLRGTFRGVIVAGLGKYDGTLTIGALTTAAKSAALLYLLRMKENLDVGAAGVVRDELKLSSLLLGFNSSAQLTVTDSVSAVVRGVVEANRRFAEQNTGSDKPAAKLRISAIEFVEFYLDTAIAAGYATQRVAELINEEGRAGTFVEAAPTIAQREGCRSRIESAVGAAYWPRIIIGDADRRELQCPPECYPPPCPAGCIEVPCNCASLPDGRKVPGAKRRTSEGIATRLKFLHVGARARAEAVVQQRQAGLIEKFVAKQITSRNYDEELGNAFFQLLVPHEFKAALRQADRMVLVLDSYTANIPWELLRDDGHPVVLKRPLVRQLSTTRFRTQVVRTTQPRAYVIGNPSTQGFWREFGTEPPPQDTSAPSLPGAESEANAVAETLVRHGYEVERAIGSNATALDVITGLYKRPYRIIHVAAHGVFEALASDGTLRTGAVLSDGLLVGAAEIAAMDNVPDLVFLNCCHLGRVDAGETRPVAYNKLAASVARELIDIGVRAVVAAGWPVADRAAQLFAETFYDSLLSDGATFGEAIFRARTSAHQRFGRDATWGAFQAYGDPEWRLAPLAGARRPQSGQPAKFVAPEELLAALSDIKYDLKVGSVVIGKAEARSKAAEVEVLLQRGAGSWPSRPEVATALGDLYGELGTDFFEQARSYYEEAMRASDEQGRVPVKAIEQLANLEARSGRSLGKVAIVRRAVTRLHTLARALRAAATQRTDLDPNIERSGLLGSAYKRLAAVHADRIERNETTSENKWEDANDTNLRRALERSAEWYGRAKDLREKNRRPSDEVEPYAMLNWLFLLPLLPSSAHHDSAKHVDLARQCAAVAHKRFATEPDFWNAVTAGDARLVEALLDGSLGLAGPQGDAVNRDVENTYRLALSGVWGTSREIDSFVTQIELLALFYRVLGGDTKKMTAERLQALAVRLRAS